MEKRDGPAQSLHDKVIAYIEGDLNKAKYDIYPNPSTSQRWSVRGEFPDILVTPKGETNVLFVIEVETSQTVTPEEARNQWKAYSSLPGTFYLIVPEKDLALAKQIIAGQGIQAKVGYFEINSSGNVSSVEYTERNGN